MAFELSKEQTRIVIVGGGLGGISTALAIKKKFGFENFLIIEQGEDVGGCWYWNTYPGCNSDTAGHWYTLSSELHPKIERYYATQPELYKYWTGLVDKYGMRKNCVVNTRVVNAIWNNNTNTYTFYLRNHKTGKESTVTAEVFINATGRLETPAYPSAKSLPGQETFQGVQFHSARWRHDVDLSGKRVAIIGNGCSSAQFLPIVAEDPTTEVYNFIRTPSWFMPRNNFKYSDVTKWAFANIPLVHRLYRWYIAFTYDIHFVGFRPWGEGLRAKAQKRVEKYMLDTANPKYGEQLIPKYPLGCKRVICDPGYLEATNLPNVHLNFDGMAEVVPEGIRTKNGEVVPLDVIIWGTGFDILNVAVDARGSDGKTLSEFYIDQGGPTAYLGTTTPGFPNMFALMGPNIATGHASAVFSEESQITYILQMLQPILEKKVKAFEVTRAASNEYNDMLQNRFEGTVFTRCTSAYRAPPKSVLNKNGLEYQSDGAGRNVGIYPGPVWLFWWWTLSPRWNDYVAHGGEQWERERAVQKTFKALVALGTLGFGAGLTQQPFRDTVTQAFTQIISKAGVLRSLIPV